MPGRGRGRESGAGSGKVGGHKDGCFAGQRYDFLSEKVITLAVGQFCELYHHSHIPSFRRWINENVNFFSCIGMQ